MAGGAARRRELESRGGIKFGSAVNETRSRSFDSIESNSIGLGEEDFSDRVVLRNFHVMRFLRSDFELLIVSKCCIIFLYTGVILHSGID